ncbi:MAG TPA: 50S ribosomal protein L9 [Acidimicrobiia bacterium]|jgi:large subunit ribosomal protein L9|nr:50S ribosomal protein L9 [Acidimicrobiia bacterium]
MKVVLRDDVDKLGLKGDLVDVADGYARNFLVPRGLAIRAESGVVRQAEAMRRNRSAREQRDREAAQAVADRLSGRTLAITARAGEGGKLFGSITAGDIVAAVQEQLGVEIDRRRLTLDEPLKELGPVELPVRLHTDVVATLSVDVVAQ